MPTGQDEKKDPSARPAAEYAVVGRIVRPHGIRGGLVLEAHSKVVAALRPGAQVHLGPARAIHIIRSLRSQQKRYILYLEGVEDRDQAEALRNHELAVPVDSLPPPPAGNYYDWQILGMEVVSDEGELLGELVEILETGANDVYVVRDSGGGELLLPAIDSVILEVDLDSRRMTVHLLPGLR
jgi:16S rRNA processing protein RimM